VQARRDRNGDSVPIEAEPAGRAPRVECCWIDLFPFRVVEIRTACVRCKIVSLDRLTGRLLVPTSGFEIDLRDFRVAITPLTCDEINTFLRGKVDHRVWLSGGSVGIRLSKCTASQKNQQVKCNYSSEAQAPHGGIHRSRAMAAIESNRPSTNERRIDQH